MQNKTEHPQLRYDVDALVALSITDVLEWLGAEPIGKEKSDKQQFRCFNGTAHKKNDTHPSMTAKITKNVCKCYACGVGGDPVSVTRAYYNGDFKKACEALHEHFGVPYLDGTKRSDGQVQMPKKREPKKIEYIEFDVTKVYTTYTLENYLPKYNEATDAQRLKMVYTYIYQYSLKTDQTKKLDWYKTVRMIPEHSLFEQIGWLSVKDIKELCKELESLFPIEDLIKFKLYQEAEAQYHPLSWKYLTDVGFTVVPFHDLYSNMVNGMMLRNISPNAGKKKEFQVSVPTIVIPIPFALTRETLACEDHIFVTEGHVDGLSLGEKPFVASPGTHGLFEEVLGLLRGKKVFIVFDMDTAGISAATKLAERLQKLNIETYILEWDPKLGNDLNELLKKGFLKKENLKIKKEKAC
ncbi:MAG: toprim domain-containing protein [Campylobacterales bacterium]|nr:toprim domain-containing protein [Campylobacterales bacterium]